LARPETDLSFSPDGTRLAAVSTDGTTRIWDVSLPVAVSAQESAGGYVRERMALPGPGTGTVDVHGPIAFSRDGSRLATASLDGVMVWDVGSGEKILSTPPIREDVPPVVVFSPDGSRLATSPEGRLGTATIRDARTGAKLLSLPGRPAEDLAFSPDGTLLATVGPGGVELWDPASGRRLRKLATRYLPDTLSFSPDGRLLAIGSTSGEVSLWDPIPARRVGTLAEPHGAGSSSIVSLTFSSDGQRLAAASTPLGGEAPVWDVATRKQILNVRVDAGGIDDVAFSPDGSRLALGFGDGTVDIRDATSGDELFVLTGYVPTASGVAFSPDGRYLASIAADGSFRIDLMRVDDLIKLAEGRVTRRLVPEECRQFLHLATCPTG